MPQRPAATLVATASETDTQCPPKGASRLSVELVDAVGEGLHDNLALELQARRQIPCLDRQFTVDDGEPLDLLPAVEMLVERVDVPADHVPGLLVACDLCERLVAQAVSWRPTR